MNRARLWDQFRCLFLPRSHRRRIRQGKRTLRKIRPWLQEPGGAPRAFGYLRTGDQSRVAAVGVVFISGQRLADLVAGRLEIPSGSGQQKNAA